MEWEEMRAAQGCGAPRAKAPRRGLPLKSGILAHRRIARLAAITLATLGLVACSNAIAGDLYWDGNGVTAGVGGPTTGTANWLGGINWSTAPAGTDASTWSNGSNAVFANQVSSLFPTGGIIVNSTALNPISISQLNFLGEAGATRTYTLLAGPSSPGLVFTGANPQILLQQAASAFIYSNLSSVNPVKVSQGIAGSGSVLNLYGANSFDGGLVITDAFRVNFNANGAAGIAGHAGPITVLATDSRLTTVGSLPVSVNQTFNINNDVILNPNYDPATPDAFHTSFSATAASPAVLTLNFAGQISGHSDVVISNDVFAKGGGAGRTMFSNHLNNYIGATYIANTGTTGALVLGNDEVIPDTSDVIFGVNTAGKQNGPIDMNGHNETVASISTNFGLGSSALGITNTSANVSTLTLAGMTAKTYLFDTTIGAASNTTPGNVVGNNNVALVLAASNDDAGILNLTKPSTYTGGTTINGGVLSLGTGGSLSSAGNMALSGNGTFDLGGKTQQIHLLAGTGGNIVSNGGPGTLNVNFDSAASTFGGVISGAVSLNKSGTGTLSLDGANTYTGATAVSRGTLLINGSSSASAMTVNSNATLGGIGTITGGVTVNGGGFLAPGKATAGNLAGNLHLDSLTLNPNATLKFDLDSTGGVNDKISVASSLTLIHGTTPINIDINNLGGLQAGVYHLVSYGSLAGGSLISDLNLHSFPTNFGYTLLNNSGSVDLQVSALNATKTWLGTTADFNTATNFAAPGVPGAADPVLFDDTAINKAINISSPVTPGPMTFANNSDYSVGGAAIAGTAPLTKTGSGKLTLSGINTFSGPIAVNGGTLSVSSDANMGSAFNSLAISNATLEATASFASGRGITLNGPANISVAGAATALTWNGVISGTSGLTVSGGGTLNLSSIDNSYVGSTTIASGTTVSLAASEVIPDTSAVSIAAGATLNTSTFNETVGSISGAGTIIIGSGKTLAAGGDGSSTAFTGVIQGAGGSLAKNGAGTLSLTNTNTFGGAGSSVSINAGTLAITSDANLGNSANAVNISDGATLSVDTSAGAFSNSRAINLIASSAGTFATISVSGANAATLSGKVGGSSQQVAGLIKTGTGTLNLGSSSNNFLGLNIAGGTIVAATDGALGSGDLTLSGGKLQLTGAFTTAKSITAATGSGGTIDTGANNITVTGVISGTQNAPITKLGSGKLTLTTPSLSVITAYNGAWNILDGTVAVNAVTPGGIGAGITPAGLSAVGTGGSTTATLFNNSITAKGTGAFEIDGVDLGQSQTLTILAPRIYLDNGGTLAATGNATTGTATYSRDDGALFVVRGVSAAAPSIVNIKTIATASVPKPVFTINDAILQQENPALQPYDNSPGAAGTGGNVVIQVSGPGRVILNGGNRSNPLSTVSPFKAITNAQNFAGSWDIQSGILQIGPVIPNTQADGFNTDPVNEPLNALGFRNNDPSQANPVLLSGGTLAVGADAYNANPNVPDPYVNTADPSINWIRSPITLKGGAIASTGFEVTYGATAEDPQGIPTNVPVTANFGGDFTVAASAANSKVLAYDPITPAQARSVNLVGSGATSWTGTLEIDPGGTTGGGFNINRSGGIVSVTPGAKIVVDQGATLHLNGVGVLSDGVHHVDILNNSAANLAVESGSHAIGNLDGVGNTVLSANTTLTATHIVQKTLTIGANAKASIRSGPSAGTLSVVNSLALGGTSAAPAGTLDLNTHDLVITNGVIADVALQIKSGRAGGTWTGKGIDSTAAGSNPRFALGYMQNGTAGSPRVASFDNQPLTGGEVLVKYTLLGDTNLDGLVDGADFSFLAANFGQSGKQWTNGDFNFDGVVDGADFSLLASNFGLSVSSFTSPAPLPGTVPEPASISLLALALTGLLSTRSKRSARGI